MVLVLKHFLQSIHDNHIYGNDKVAVGVISFSFSHKNLEYVIYGKNTHRILGTESEMALDLPLLNLLSIKNN